MANISTAEALVLINANNHYNYSYSLTDSLINLSSAATGIISSAVNYSLSNTTGSLGAITVANAIIALGAVNINAYSFSLSDSLMHLTAAPANVLSAASTITLSDPAGTLNNITVAEAAVLLNASNHANYSYNLLDSLANLSLASASVINNAQYYFLSNPGGNLSWLTVAQANIVVAASNHSLYSYYLSDSLANLTAANNNVINTIYYQLTDTQGLLANITIAEAKIFLGASNHYAYSYTLLDSLANLSNAGSTVLSNAVNYSLADNSGLLAAISVAKAQIVLAAVNHSAYSYTLADSLANLTLAANNVLTSATSYTLTDAQGLLSDISAAEALVLQGASNVNLYRYILLDSLVNLTALPATVLNHAQSYYLSNPTGNLSGISISAGLVLLGANNVHAYSYFINDSLLNLTAAPNTVLVNASYYQLTENSGFLNGISVDEGKIVIGANNRYAYTYSLTDNFNDLLNAPATVLANTQNYTISNTSGSLGSLTVIQAEILLGAVNHTDYSYTLSDSLANLVAAPANVLADASSYSLTNAQGLLSNISAFSANILLAASNHSNYSYTLYDSLLNLTAASPSNLSHALHYYLNDNHGQFYAINVAEANVLLGASNANFYSYILSDNLVNLSLASHATITGASYYQLTDNTGFLNNITVAEANVLAAASNHSNYSYSLLDSLANLLQAAPGILSGAVNYSVTNTTLLGLSAAEIALAQGASNYLDLGSQYSLDDSLAQLVLLSPAALAQSVGGYSITNVNLNNITVAELIIAQGANNYSSYLGLYSLADSLANLENAAPSILSGASSYALTDSNYALGLLNLSNAALVVAASNHQAYSYSLIDNLADFAAAAAGVVAGASSYALTDANPALGTLSLAEATLVNGASNHSSYQYSLSDTLSNLANAAPGVVSGATSFTLTDANPDLGSIPLSKAVLVLEASNGSSYNYSLSNSNLNNISVAQYLAAEHANNFSQYLSYSLQDNLVNLENANTSIITGAACYSLTNPHGSLGYQSLVDASLISGASNAASYSYSLIASLANLASAGSVVLAGAKDGYTLSDSSGSLGLLSLSNANIVVGASNASNYSYSLINSLAQLAAVSPLVVFGATDGYTLTDSNLIGITVAELHLAKAASNYASYTTYSLSDSLANLAAATASDISNALGYSLTNAAGFLSGITVAQQGLIAAASNAASYTGYSLNDTLIHLFNAPAVLAAAHIYSLSNFYGTLGTLNLTAASIVLGAVNANYYTYTLSASLAEIIANPSVAAHAQGGYYLTDTIGSFNILSLSAATIVAGALNASNYSYSLHAPLSQLAALSPAVLAGATLGYSLTDANLNGISVASLSIAKAASNYSDYAGVYSLSDNLANLTAAPQAILTAATSYSITNPSGMLTNISVAQADILYGASNHNNYGYTLLDSLQNLSTAAPGVLAGAEYYYLNNNQGGFSWLTVAQAAILEGASNHSAYSYYLSDSLANLVAAGSGLLAGAIVYQLLDNPGFMNNLTVAQADVVMGANNRSNYSYSLNDSLANLANALPGVLPAAQNYTLTDSNPHLGVLTTLQATILAGAINHSAYDYSLTDSLVHLTAATANVVATATSYTLTDAAGLQNNISAAAAAIIYGATNHSQYSYIILDSLVNLSALAAPVLSHAQYYFLTNPSGGLAWLTVQQALVLQGASNYSQYSFYLSDSLANLTTVPNLLHLSAVYYLTDSNGLLNGITAAEGNALIGAGNRSNYTYSLSDSLANLTNALPGVTSGAMNYTLTNSNGSLGSLSVTQADILKYAVNHADYSYSLSDTLLNLTTALPGVLTGATSYSLTNAAGLLSDISATEAQVLLTAVNHGQYSYIILDSLVNLTALAPSVLANAQYYFLSNSAGNLSWINVLQANVLQSASNANEFSYYLSDSLANLTAASASVLNHAITYQLSDNSGLLNGLTVLEGDVLANAGNRYNYIYSLTDSLANLTNAHTGVVANAQNITLTDVAGTLAGLSIAQADILLIAVNKSNYSYSLFDSLLNLVSNPSVVAGATSYSLNDASGVLNNITAAAAALILGASNHNAYSYSLLDTLNNLTNATASVLAIAHYYYLSDSNTQFSAITAAQATVLLAASNHAQYSYYLNDSLANLAAANPAVLTGAYFYNLTNNPGYLNTMSAAQATVLLGANNQANYSYSLIDTLQNLASVNPNVLSHAANYSLTNNAGLLGNLTVNQAAIVVAAINHSDYSYNITDSLLNLTTAHALLATATNYTLNNVAGLQSNITTAEAQTLLTATNHSNYSYSLLDTLSDLSSATPAVLANAQTIYLSNATGWLSNLTVTSAHILFEASNHSLYSYALVDSLTNLTAANATLLNNASYYQLTDNNGLLNNINVAEAQILLNANNHSNYSYTLIDSLVDLEHASSAVITSAANYTLTDAAGLIAGSLSAVNAELVVNASNNSNYSFNVVDSSANILQTITPNFITALANGSTALINDNGQSGSITSTGNNVDLILSSLTQNLVVNYANKLTDLDIHQLTNGQNYSVSTDNSGNELLTVGAYTIDLVGVNNLQNLHIHN